MDHYRRINIDKGSQDPSKSEGVLYHPNEVCFQIIKWIPDEIINESLVLT